MDKKYFVVLVGLFAALPVAAATSGVSPRCSSEQYQVMMQTLEKGDYDAWKAQIEKNGRGRKRILELINKDNFGRFAEMHRLRASGKDKEADVIRGELSLGRGRGHGRWQGMGCGSMRQQ